MADQTAGLTAGEGSWSVDDDHPLTQFLSRLPVWGESLGRPIFEFEQANSARTVLICRERQSGRRVVCKFFSARPGLSPLEARHVMAYEWFSLRRSRALGLNTPPFLVVRPLAVRVDLGCLLAEDYVEGESLDDFIWRAAHAGETEPLILRLDRLAEFFAAFHALEVRSSPPRLSRTCVEFRNLIGSLDRAGELSHAALSDVARKSRKWEACRYMWDGYSSLVHGDATPTNFLFQGSAERTGDSVTAIDLERMHFGDPVYDVGLLVAELKHHFALRIFSSEAAEPFISRFLHSYARYSSITEDHFDWLAFRSRFYMALGELRIARNPWLPTGHRNWLIAEAGRCLA